MIQTVSRFFITPLVVFSLIGAGLFVVQEQAAPVEAQSPGQLACVAATGLAGAAAGLAVFWNPPLIAPSAAAGMAFGAALFCFTTVTLAASGFDSGAGYGGGGGGTGSW